MDHVHVPHLVERTGEVEGDHVSADGDHLRLPFLVAVRASFITSPGTSWPPAGRVRDT
ncbi:MAG TPA: hypothetical protein VFE25_16345 [Opitutaceae bacterium]|jgi:hypothetical protein|nr:hypothetical protein [Opitutaceae bacterium]